MTTKAIAILAALCGYMISCGPGICQAGLNYGPDQSGGPNYNQDQGGPNYGPRPNDGSPANQEQGNAAKDESGCNPCYNSGR